MLGWLFVGYVIGKDSKRPTYNYPSAFGSSKKERRLYWERENAASVAWLFNELRKHRNDFERDIKCPGHYGEFYRKLYGVSDSGEVLSPPWAQTAEILASHGYSVDDSGYAFRWSDQPVLKPHTFRTIHNPRGGPDIVCCMDMNDPACVTPLVWQKRMQKREAEQLRAVPMTVPDNESGGRWLAIGAGVIFVIMALATIGGG